MTKTDTGGRAGEAGRTARIEYAKLFAWGYRNYVGGSDDWRCGSNIRIQCNLDDNDDPMAYDDGPCDCAECEGATVRAFDRGKPSLTTRVLLNLAARASLSATKGGEK